MSMNIKMLKAAIFSGERNWDFLAFGFFGSGALRCDLDDLRAVALEGDLHGALEFDFATSHLAIVDCLLHS